MNRAGPIEGARDVRPLRIFGKIFLYHEPTSAHMQVDRREWSRFCARGKHEGNAGSRSASIPAVDPFPAPHVSQHENNRPPDLRNIVLQISHACNLRCDYCGADFGRYGQDFRMMTAETARTAIDFLFAQTRSDDLAVTYFGGEPLLNFDAVLDSARYACERAAVAKKTLSLHLVTNGVLLDSKVLRQLDRYGFSLTVSLDGPPDSHDAHRRSANGSRSYQATADALRNAASMPIGKRITVRGTFTRDTVAFSPIVKFLVQEGFSRNIAYEPVFLPPRHPLSLRWKDLPAIKRAYVELASYYVSRLKDGNAFCLWDFDDAILQLLAQRPRLSRCGAGVTCLAVTAEGDLYGCHMSTGMRKAWIGHLEGGFDVDSRRPWTEKYLQGRPGCSTCWARHLCGGGCNAHAIQFNHDICRPYRLDCEMIRWRYRLAFWILAECPEIVRAFQVVTGNQAGQGRDSGHVVSPLWSYLEQYTAGRRVADTPPRA